MGAQHVPARQRRTGFRPSGSADPWVRKRSGPSREDRGEPVVQTTTASCVQACNTLDRIAREEISCFETPWDRTTNICPAAVAGGDASMWRPGCLRGSTWSLFTAKLSDGIRRAELTVSTVLRAPQRDQLTVQSSVGETTCLPVITAVISYVHSSSRR